jgi:hypothetical protein
VEKYENIFIFFSYPLPASLKVLWMRKGERTDKKLFVERLTW